MNLRQLLYGLLSYLPGIPDSLYKGTGGTDSAQYCYSIWLRHLVLARRGGMSDMPDVVAELGPGDSLGVGLAALLSGVRRYVALDAVVHANSARNLQVLDGLVELFRQRAPIPGPGSLPGVSPVLDDYAFPAWALSEERFRWAQSEARIARMRAILAGEIAEPSLLDYRAPWEQVGGADSASVDLLVSNAVLEHVEGIEVAYRAMATWLRPGGYASHQIDFRSHSLFRAWDGHWACPDWLWRMFKGRRAYLLNRQPLGVHRALAAAVGLKERVCVRVERDAEARRLAPAFRGMAEQDRLTSGAYLLLQRPV